MSEMATKRKKVEYGIAITKPWSREMYDHNDLVSEQMKRNLRELIEMRFADGDLARLNELSKYICWCRLDIGSYDLQETYQELIRGLDDMANYQLNDEYEYMVEKLGVPEVEVKFVGFVN
tara:strand:- start:92 stop:451 length:360 start_codon:yes stop_codon:yes gene_type:complete